MKKKVQRLRFRLEKLTDFLEATYRLDTDDQAWLAEVTETSRQVWGRDGWVHSGFYDASDVTTFRAMNQHSINASEVALTVLLRSIEFFTPSYVARSFRTLAAVASGAKVSYPELKETYSNMEAIGWVDCQVINGVDPTGIGVYIGLWSSDPHPPPTAEMSVYRRMGYHLAAAHRCRRRVRETQAAHSSFHPTDDAEAVLDVRGRVLHATGPATDKRSQAQLVETSRARELVRSSRTEGGEGLRRWSPLTSARWTLIDSFEHNGQRYIVARENQARVTGLQSLSDRERQVVAYLAIGQSTKETAYALGISDATVRVLLARAAAKLGVKTRRDLLQHPEVRPLVPPDPRM